MVHILIVIRLQIMKKDLIKSLLCYQILRIKIQSVSRYKALQIKLKVINIEKN